MIKSKDLVGMKFNMLTVESLAEKRRSPNGSCIQMFNCICDCGNNTVVSRSHLMSGGVKSCGCLRYADRYDDLVGKTFGYLTVIKHIGRVGIGTQGQYSHLWKCRCKCGNICNVNSRSLNSGNTKSCGCIQGEKLRSAHLNTYDMSHDYGIGYCVDGTEFLFDIADYNMIKKYTWWRNDQGYILATYKGEQIRMHRLIMGLSFDDELVVDHINHNKNDNRRANLRVCTCQQNAYNKATPANNTTGHIGVSLSKNKRKFRAYIAKDKKSYNLGEFDKIEDAIEAREKAEKEFFNEFAYER